LWGPGVTANPTIFEKAISGSTDYDEAIRELVRKGATPPEIYESPVLEDIRAAADVLRSVYDLTNGLDGYVSVEVSPKLAHDTRGVIEEAREFFSRIARANVMVKVPATDEGIPAIRQLIGEGLNINITLIFAGERFAALREKGARVQRPLWASTGTKNPAYRDVVYVEELIGPQTVSAMPPATLEAFVDHGRVEQTIDKELDAARQTIRELEARGSSMKEVTDKLLLDGVESFAESFESLDRAIRCKSETLRVEVAGRQVADLARA
jgi:transaldolase